MEKCEVNASEIKRLEKRISLLEQYREKDKTQVYELDKSLNVFITEMKNISDELKTIVSNFKEAIVRSTNAQEKELTHLKEQVLDQGKQIKALETKLEHETIEKDAEKWNNTSKYILTTILGLIIGYIFFQLGLKK